MSNVCGTGGWGGPKPGDPDNNSILTASPAFGGIDVSWSLPVVNGFAVAHVLLYRGLLETFDGAIQIAVVGGDSYYDKLDANYRYYYWIQIVSINGTVGELIGPASAVARPLIEDVIEILTGQIDEGVLAQSLKSSIDRITLNHQELLSEVVSRSNGDAALGQVLELLQFSSEETLATLSEEITRRIDGDSALVSSVNQIAVSNANNAAVIQQEQQARITADSALASSITTLGAATNSNAAAILTEAQARTTADAAETQARTTLAARVTSAEGSLVASNAAITNEASTRATADNALSNQVSTLVSTVNSNDTKQTAAMTSEAITRANADSALTTQYNALVSTVQTNNSTQSAAIVTEATARANADSASATQITTLSSTVSTNHTAALGAASTAQSAATGAQITANTAVTNAATAQTAANAANTALTNLASDGVLSPSEKPIVVQDYSAITAEQSGIGAQATAYGLAAQKTAYDTAISALTTYLNGLTGWNVIPGSDVVIVGVTFRARFLDVYAKRQLVLDAIVGKAKALADTAQTTANEAVTTGAANTAAIQTEATTRANADTALAAQITTVQSAAGNNLASAQTTLQTNINAVNGKVTEIGSLYSAKVTVNGLIGGFGVYNNGTTVEAGFDVDTFWVGRTAANKRKPFIISGNETFIDAAVINTASIANAKISTAQIADATISTAQIANATIGAAQVTGTLTASQINGTNLAVVNGSFSGALNVASATSGARMEIKNNVIKVFDSNGVLRVQLGDLSV
jgi:hypothetical protein